MFRSKMSEIDIKGGVRAILQRIDEAYAQRPKDIQAPKPCLVAVSKTKPIQLILDAYSVGQRHFGENYVKELVDKSRDKVILEKCPEIKWHFIGHLQNNKINKVIKLPNLYMIQTVDSQKLAEGLNSALEKNEADNKEPFKILIQINTSGEEAKNGVHPSEACELYKFIKENCKNLSVEGIMTIGAFGHDYSSGPNPDFIRLMQVHKTLCQENKLDPASFHVSMGMSDDFEEAIEMGSTIVRVGSSIFGHRERKQ